MTFNLPDGVNFLGDDGDESYSLSVSIPSDEHGFFGRQCPQCGDIYRVSGVDYDELPDDLQLWCVYCGHHEDHSEFLTDQQRERALRAVGDIGAQLIGQMLDQSFGSLARRHRRGALTITYRSKPFFPDPLPGISEEQLIRQRSCGSCGLHYAVFGEHRFCPVCGPLPADVAAFDALAAEQARLDALAQIPAAAQAVLREQGGFDRLYVDTIENAVGIVENLAKAVFTSRVSSAAQVLKGKGNVFQRLGDTADLFHDHLDIDLRASMGSEWQSLLVMWAGRHVYTHRDGLIDSKYLAAAPGCVQAVGQRLRITEADARQAITLASRLCRLFPS